MQAQQNSGDIRGWGVKERGFDLLHSRTLIYTGQLSSSMFPHFLYSPLWFYHLRGSNSPHAAAHLWRREPFVNHTDLSVEKLTFSSQAANWYVSHVNSPSQYRTSGGGKERKERKLLERQIFFFIIIFIFIFWVGLASFLWICLLFLSFTFLVPEHFTTGTGLIPQEKTCLSLKCVLTQQVRILCDLAKPLLGGLPRNLAYVLDLSWLLTGILISSHFSCKPLSLLENFVTKCKLLNVAPAHLY